MITLLIKPGTYNEFDFKYALEIFLGDNSSFAGIALKFRNYVAIVEADDAERIWFFKLSDTSSPDKSDPSDYTIDYSSAKVVSNNNGKNWLLHYIYSTFRLYYDELNSADFPVGEIEITPFYEFWVDFDFVRTDMLYLLY